MNALVAYRAALICDPNSESRVSNAYVLVKDAQIQGVVNTAPSDARVVDLGDVTLLPGLIDTHVHLAWDASAEPQASVLHDPRPLTALRAAQHARQHLFQGVTTVRDVGCPDGHAFAVRSAVQRGITVGPRIVASGYALATVGGHVVGHLAREVVGADQMRAAVRREVKDGARSIKLMASGGITGDVGEDPGRPELSVDELTAAVDEAHRVGIPITAHAHSREAICNALDAGVDSIEHGSDLDLELVLRMRDTRTALSVTITAVESLIDHGPAIGVPNHVLAKAQEAAPRWAASASLAIAHGVGIVAGTDAGIPGQRHGRVADEVGRLGELGLSRWEALRSATADAAAVLGLAGITGSLTAGLSADLCAVAGDPTEDLACLRTVRAIVAQGRFYPADPGSWQLEHSPAQHSTAAMPGNAP